MLFMKKLSIEHDQTIIISSEDTIQEITGYSDGDVFFQTDNQSYQIYGEFPLQIFLLTLKKLLTKSLFGNLQLHHSIHQNIGYLYNRQGNDPTFIATQYTDQNNDTYWVGINYELGCYNYVAWIYNDEESNIIFEITPAYPRRIDQGNPEELEHYQAWMQEYKSTYKTIISDQTAQQWLLQIQEILDAITQNMQALSDNE